MKIELEYESIACANCGQPIICPSGFLARRRKDHETFHCLNGHTNYFPQKSDEEVLRERVDKLVSEKNRLQKELTEATRPRKRGRPRKG